MEEKKIIIISVAAIIIFVVLIFFDILPFTCYPVIPGTDYGTNGGDGGGFFG